MSNWYTNVLVAHRLLNYVIFATTCDVSQYWSSCQDTETSTESCFWGRCREWIKWWRWGWRCSRCSTVTPKNALFILWHFLCQTFHSLWGRRWWLKDYQWLACEIFICWNFSFCLLLNYWLCVFDALFEFCSMFLVHMYFVDLACLQDKKRIDMYRQNREIVSSWRYRCIMKFTCDASQRKILLFWSGDMVSKKKKRIFIFEYWKYSSMYQVHI